MTKFLYVSAILAASVLAIITMHLAWLNRSPKIYAPLFSIFIGAITATFITLLTVLKPLKMEGKFPVSIVLDDTIHLPAILPFETIGTSALQSTLWLARNEDDPNNIGSLRQRQVNFQSVDEEIKFYAEVLQLGLFQELFKLTSGGSGGSVSTSSNGRQIVKAILSADLRPKNFSKMTGNDVLNVLSQNQFCDSMQKNFWRHPGRTFSVPAECHLSFPDKNSIILERPDFYRISFTIQHAASGPGYPPHLVKLIDEKNVKTLVYSVKYEADFTKYTAENPDSLDVKEWVVNIFGALKKRMADPNE